MSVLKAIADELEAQGIRCRVVTAAAQKFPTYEDVAKNNATIPSFREGEFFRFVLPKTATDAAKLVYRTKSYGDYELYIGTIGGELFADDLDIVRASPEKFKRFKTPRAAYTGMLKLVKDVLKARSLNAVSYREVYYNKAIKKMKPEDVSYSELLNVFAEKSERTMFDHAIEYISNPNGSKHDAYYLEPVPSMSRHLLGNKLATVAFAVYLPSPSSRVELRLFVNINPDMSTSFLLTATPHRDGQYADTVSAKNAVTFSGGILPDNDSKFWSDDRLDEALHKLIVRNAARIEKHGADLAGSKLPMQIK